ncbi:MAG: DUF3748 domain-containing protein, partial [Gemmataceae bacterium]
MTPTPLRILPKTQGRCILTHAQVWSPDSRELVFDTRSDPAGSCFDGTELRLVDVQTGLVRTVYSSAPESYCGVALFHPTRRQIVFIQSPNLDSQWTYGPSRRHGRILNIDQQESAVRLDGCDLSLPSAQGCLRGGSHVHLFHPGGEWLSFTYEDEMHAQFRRQTPMNTPAPRTIAIAKLNTSSQPRSEHPQNSPGTAACAILVPVSTDAKTGS